MTAGQIKSICYDMKIGQQIKITGRIFAQAFRAFGFSTIYNNSQEVFLSGMTGAAWGGFRVHLDMMEDVIVILRHKESEKRYYVDPDRAYMFKRMPDGTLELKSEFKMTTDEEEART